MPCRGRWSSARLRRSLSPEADDRVSQRGLRVPVLHRDRQRHQRRDPGHLALLRGASCWARRRQALRECARSYGRRYVSPRRITASVAYASLVITVFRGFRHFGIIGGVGILLCWASGYLVLPAALSIARQLKMHPRREGRRSAACGSRSSCLHGRARSRSRSSRLPRLQG